MEMYVDFSQVQEQQFDQHVSPTLIAFANLLVLSSYDLQQRIREELEQNPALEVMEQEEFCPRCGDHLVVGLCPRCHRLSDDTLLSTTSYQDGYPDDFDPLTQVASQESLPEALLSDLRTLLPEDNYPIAEFLCGSLDESGFLAADIEDIACALGVSTAQVLQVLELLQCIGPAGIGARSVRECLELQLCRWEKIGSVPSLVRPILEGYFEELGKGQYSFIASRLKVTLDKVIEGRDFIRAHLRPYPIREGGAATPWSSVTETTYVSPDIVITERDSEPGEYDVSLVESRVTPLRINPYYLELSKEGAGNGALAKRGVSHVHSHVQQAHSFIGHIAERRRTMKRVALEVVERQKAFLRHGWSELQPLTRNEIAQTLDLHESTVSRAVARRYVMLPNRQVIPFARFFQASAGVRELLREIIANETVPLTDNQLQKRLEKQGFFVARRTVAKYRNEMGILSSHLR